MFSLSAASRSTLRTTVVRGGQVRLESTRFYSSTMHDNDPKVLEREKLRNLSKTLPKHSPHEHAPGWNEALASASEAAVKADRSSGSADELVSSTMQFLRLRDESEIEESSSTTAPYSKDEVHGPLKGLGKEEVIIEQNTVVRSGKGTSRVKKEAKMTSSEENVKANRGET